MGRPEGAEELFAQVVERWPRSPYAVQARLRLARSAIAQGKFAAAAAVLERFLAETPDAPDRPAALLLLAAARHLAGDGYLALLDYQRLVREAPQSPYAPVARAALGRLRGDAIQRAAK
jgi:TolA-binding protein